MNEPEDIERLKKKKKKLRKSSAQKEADLINAALANNFGGAATPNTNVLLPQPLNALTTNQLGQTVATTDPRLALLSDVLPNVVGDSMGGQPAVSNLEVLRHVDCIYLEQRKDDLECCCCNSCASCCDLEGRYKAFDCSGRFLFYIEESSCCCLRCMCMCSARRPFEMAIRGTHDKEIIHMVRPANCGSSFCCFCLDRIDVYCPPGVYAGMVERRFSLVGSKFVVVNADGETLFQIFGPCCTKRCCCCGHNVLFRVCNNAGDQIGRIAKQWQRRPDPTLNLNPYASPNYGRLYGSGTDDPDFRTMENFGVSFPPKLEVEIKAILIAACILVELSFFEGRNSEIRKARRKSNLNSEEENGGGGGRKQSKR